MLFVGLNLTAGILNTEGEWQCCRNVSREELPSLFSAHLYDSFIFPEQAGLSFSAVAWLTYLTCAVVMSWAEICASWKWACIRSNIYAFAKESSWNTHVLQHTFNSIGRRMTASPFLLSPLSILPSPASYCTFVSARRYLAGVSNAVIQSLYWFKLS